MSTLSQHSPIISDLLMRPTEKRVEAIVRKYEDTSVWDKVFDDLIWQCKDESDAVKIIHMVFRDGKHECEICKELSISRPTFYSYRMAILSRAAVLAISAEIIKV